MNKQTRRSGQAMIIAILTLGGAILGATALAGLLMLYNIRSTTDSMNSARSIFAADAGVEWALYSAFNTQVASPAFSNGESDFATCYDANDQPLAVCDNSGVGTSSYAISKGTSLNSRRAFYVDLADATATLP